MRLVNQKTAAVKQKEILKRYSAVLPKTKSKSLSKPTSPKQKRC
jgi:hypothetical protein